MFFTLSKILWACAAPLNLIFLILLAGVIIGIFSRGAGRSLVVLSLFLLVIGGVFPTGARLLQTLENRYEKPATLPDHVDGILVLGGSFMTNISEKRGLPALNEASERLYESMVLARTYPQAIVVFSGGSGSLLSATHTEARDAQMFFESMGLPQDNIFYEDRSRNTYENFIYSRDMVLPQKGETWLLVTSAYHMPRAVAVAQTLGWDGIIPFPVDFRTTGDTAGWLPADFDMLGHLFDLHVALHEYIGLLAYQLTGKISLPSP